MNKLTNANIGLDDAASMYVGHAICNFLVHSMDEENDMHTLLPQCISRMIKTELPAIIKSMSLPVCFVFVNKQEHLLNILNLWSQKLGQESMVKFFEKIVGNFEHNF